MIHHRPLAVAHRGTQRVQVATIRSNERAAQQVEPFRQMRQHLLPGLPCEHVRVELGNPVGILAPALLLGIDCGDLVFEAVH